MEKLFSYNRYVFSILCIADDKFSQSVQQGESFIGLGYIMCAISPDLLVLLEYGFVRRAIVLVCQECYWLFCIIGHGHMVLRSTRALNQYL